MSTQTKSKLYILIISILLITNIVMLFFFLNKDGGRKNNNNNNANHDRRAMMREFLQKQVGFNDQQLQNYDTISKLFKEKTRTDFDTLRSNKEEQFRELGANGFSDSAINNVANRSAANQKIMEWQLMNHFATIRKICTPEQQPKFDSLFYKIWSKKKRPDDKKPEEKK